MSENIAKSTCCPLSGAFLFGRQNPRRFWFGCLSCGRQGPEAETEAEARRLWEATSNAPQSTPQPPPDTATACY